MSESAAAVDPVDKKDRDFQIIVNGTPVVVEDETVSFEQVTGIAYPEPPFPETMFSVTYRNAKKPRQGTLVEGQSVEVRKDGTIFNVKATDKS